MFKRKKERKYVSIYVVDDTFFVRKSIYEYLYKKPQNMEFEVNFDFVGEASLKREVLDQLPRLKADILFIDMDLPDGTVWEMIDEIYRYLPQAKIIAMTDANTVETQQLRQLHEHKVVSVLEKPFQANHLYEVFEMGVQAFFRGEPSNPFPIQEPASGTNFLSFEEEQGQVFLMDDSEEELLLNGEVFQKPTSTNQFEDQFEFKFEIEEESSTSFSLSSTHEPDAFTFFKEQEDEASKSILKFNDFEFNLKEDETFTFEMSSSTEEAFSFDQESFNPIQPVKESLTFSQSLLKATDSKESKRNVVSLIMDEVFEDDEFEIETRYSFKESSRANPLSDFPSKEEKNEETDEFNLFYPLNREQTSSKEEKLPVFEEINPHFFEKEENCLQNEKTFPLSSENEEKNRKIEEINLQAFEFRQPAISSDFDLTSNWELKDFDLEEGKSESASLKTSTPSSEAWSFDFQSQDLENSARESETSIQTNPELNFEYFNPLEGYTETSQTQTQEFSLSEESNNSLAFTSLNFDLSEQVKPITSTSSPQVQTPKPSEESSSKASSPFVISPPRGKGPGVPTNPKEFGRFGIRK